MLKKDEYNQDEYNDYYAQEVRGAEISGSGGEESSGKKIMLIFLLLLLIVTVGYFGWKSMNSSNSTDNGISKGEIASVENRSEIVKEETPVETAIESTDTTEADKIAEQVENIASSDSAKGKMNSEDIANIVQMVMMKMNQDKSKEDGTPPQSSTADNTEQLEDSNLMDSLSDASVDSLSSISDNVDSITDSDNKKSASGSSTADTYNKVVLNSASSNDMDDLSKLSDELSSVIDSGDTDTSTNDSSYTKSITKEVETRTREMRYIVVRKGDTLGKIAKRAYGNAMDYKKIYEANPDILRRPDRIYIGQKLRIP